MSITQENFVEILPTLFLYKHKPSLFRYNFEEGKYVVNEVSEAIFFNESDELLSPDLKD